MTLSSSRSSSSSRSVSQIKLKPMRARFLGTSSPGHKGAPEEVWDEFDPLEEPVTMLPPYAAVAKVDEAPHGHDAVERARDASQRLEDDVARSQLPRAAPHLRSLDRTRGVHRGSARAGSRPCAATRRRRPHRRRWPSRSRARTSRRPPPPNAQGHASPARASKLHEPAARQALHKQGGGLVETMSPASAESRSRTATWVRYAPNRVNNTR